MSKTGPNNASRVVWALVGDFFFFSFHVFYILINDLYYIKDISRSHREVREGGDDENGYKRCEMHRLGPR